VFSRQFYYSDRDGETIFRYLVGTCLDNTSVSDYCLSHKAVSRSTIHKLGKIPLVDMTRKCNRLLETMKEMAIETGLYKGCDTSIDYHDRPYAGKRKEYTIKTLVNGKYRRCYRYAVSSLTGNKRFLALRVHMYREGDSNKKTVEKLLEDHTGGLVLMDRYFAGVDVYNHIEKRNMNFLTPYKINDTTDNMYLESLLDGEQVKKYHVRKRYGGWKTVYMHLVPDPVDEYHAYASSTSNVNVKEHYPFRWNVENLFKTFNNVKAVTSTTNESFRLLLFTIGLVLASLWKLLVRSRQHITVKQYKKQLQTFLEELFDTFNKNKTTTHD
jgi:hypothetical protein